MLHGLALIAVATINLSEFNTTDSSPLSFYLVTTSEARYPNWVLAFDWGGGADSREYLFADNASPMDSNKVHLMPGSNGTFYIVGAFEASCDGYMSFFDIINNLGAPSTKFINAETFDPVRPPGKGQFRFVQSSLSKDTDVAYHIVSTALAPNPREMLYISDPTDGWQKAQSLPYNASDATTLWKVLPAPPSPPIDFQAVHFRAHIMPYVIAAVVFCVLGCSCCMLIVYARRSDKTSTYS